ncbi:MAG: hypothetical protein PHH87_09450 [Desulfuromonas sp.]|nr:hypothetical protein [Desulfuromonas sp.]
MSAFYVETLLQQGVGKFNEDTVLVGDNLFGVFDGASSLDGRLCQGKSGAWWVAQTGANFSNRARDVCLMNVQNFSKLKIFILAMKSLSHLCTNVSAASRNATSEKLKGKMHKNGIDAQ